ncbi:MAG: hypothetical protein JOZ77_08520 [Candidatus Eremiobacteraeota bacterium]|nr:hypothetical protein [Candidatus Eremiobacteraeota bacterium]
MRNAVPADLEQCLRLAPDRFLYDSAHLDALHRMWSHIIVSKAGELGVLVDPRRPSEILFFGVSVFVSDEKVERYHALTSPGIAYRMTEDWDRGRRPFLALDEIGAANAGSGLNIVVTHYAFAIESGDNALGDELRYATYESFRKHHAGLNFRSFTGEMFARDSREMGKGWGFRIGEYPKEKLLAARIPPENTPCVWMATREDACAPGAVFPGALFHTFARPRFGFNLKEQDLLKLALEGRTDESIASITGASLSTVKRHFRALYEKVQDVSLAADAISISEKMSDGARGVEVRRQLLNYLRGHPEELHPYGARRNDTIK